MVRFYTFEKFHSKKDVGSTRLRAHNLIKHWDEADLYKYGEHPDVLIFQKVYVTFDHQFPVNFKGIKILDVCDPDWKDTPDIFIKGTMDAMDAVVVPTESMREYLQQMTDTPVRIIKDRFEISEFPRHKRHTKKAKTALWFGYAHNAVSVKFAMPSLEARDLNLICISNEDPMLYKWANNSNAYEKKYKFIKYSHPPYKDIQRADVCIFPESNRPFDRFKSENKTVISQLCGVPVVKNAEELDKMLDPKVRQKHIEENYARLKKDYDCRKSVQMYKELINELKSNR